MRKLIATAVAAVGFSILLPLGPNRLVDAQTLPTDFVLESVATGFNEAVGFTILPDGRFLVIEQRTGNVKIVAGSTVSTIATIPNVRADANERGLLGIDVDPRWPAQPFVYLYYTHLSPASMRLIRMTASGDLSTPSSTTMSLSSPYLMIDDIPHNASNHNGGTVRFGPDGMLYLSIGEDANPCAAQQTDDLRGVILRLDVRGLPLTGSGPPARATLIPAGNPFAGPNDNARITWAYGLRNPYRFNIDPVTGELFIADVGASTQEELDNCAGGENFGWPWFEGTAPGGGCGGQAPPTVGPIATFQRAEGQSIISMGLYRNRTNGLHKFGNDYGGSAFYTDFYTGRMRRVQKVNNVWITPPPVPGQPTPGEWATGMSFVSQALVGEDGAIYFTSHVAGTLNRIRYAPRLPTVTAASQAPAGGNYQITVSRDSGDVVLLHMGTSLIAGQRLPGYFGEQRVNGFILAGGAANVSGDFTFNFGNVPIAAVGLTFHFQAIAVAGNDNFISLPASTTVVGP